MKINWKIFAIGAVITLLSVNIFLFSRSIIIGDNIVKLENDIHQVQLSNMDLEQKLYTLDSLDNLTQEATAMGFTKETQPVNLNSITFALAK